jgi:hypothetical protein
MMTLDSTGTCAVCPDGECPPGPRFGIAFQIHSFASAGLYIHTHTRTQHAEEKEATTNAQMRQFNSIVFLSSFNNFSIFFNCFSLKSSQFYISCRSLETAAAQ